MTSQSIRLFFLTVITLPTMLPESVTAMAQEVDAISNRQRFHAAQPRQEPSPTPSPIPTPTVDFGSMPSCGISNCVYPSTTSYPCPTTYPSPCPSGGGNNCSTVSLDCYCNLATPYECAFHPCSWYNVIVLENWFNETCSSRVDPTISYNYVINSVRKYVPSCALGCLRTQTVNYGCTSESRNCFCSHEVLYGCTEGCSTKDNSTLADWLAETCQISSEKALKIVQEDNADDSSQKSGGPMPPHPPAPLHWYEIMAMVIFVASVLAFLVIVIGPEVFKKFKGAYKMQKLSD